MNPAQINKVAKEIQAHAVDLYRLHIEFTNARGDTLPGYESAIIDRMLKVPVWYRKQVYDAFRYLKSPVSWLEEEDNNETSST